MKGDNDCMICGKKFRMVKSFARHYIEEHLASMSCKCWCGMGHYFSPQMLTSHFKVNGGPRKHYLECLTGTDEKPVHATVTFGTTGPIHIQPGSFVCYDDKGQVIPVFKGTTV